MPTTGLKKLAKTGKCSFGNNLRTAVSHYNDPNSVLSPSQDVRGTYSATVTLDANCDQKFTRLDLQESCNINRPCKT